MQINLAIIRDELSYGYIEDLNYDKHVEILPKHINIDADIYFN
jgi:hypothetical protein